MNTKEREQFWKTLCSIGGSDENAELKRLTDAVKMPRYIYRYRPLSVGSLEALASNKLYFSTANYYDDPFDTFIRINLDGIQSILTRAKNDVNDEQFNRWLDQGIAGLFGQVCSKDQISFIASMVKRQLLDENSRNAFLNSLQNLRNEIKKRTWSICFCEDGLNESLWIKYADQYKGFVLQYDFLDQERNLCGQYEKCSSCILNHATPIFPIYYSDEKNDSTALVAIYAAQKLFLPEVFDTICAEKGINTISIMRENFKAVLIKKKCHEYDREWRMLGPDNLQRSLAKRWIPEAVYLGMRMDADNKELVRNIAKQAGIPNVYETTINTNGDLDII